MWFRELIEQANVEHELHFVDASDALCKGQLADQKSLPAAAPWTTEAEFAAITAYFQPPSEDEHFNVVRHERAQVTVDKSQFHSQPGQRVLTPVAVEKEPKQ